MQINKEHNFALFSQLKRYTYNHITFKVSSLTPKTKRHTFKTYTYHILLLFISSQKIANANRLITQNHITLRYTHAFT